MPSLTSWAHMTRLLSIYPSLQLNIYLSGGWLSSGHLNWTSLIVNQAPQFSFHPLSSYLEQPITCPLVCNFNFSWPHCLQSKAQILICTLWALLPSRSGSGFLHQPNPTSSSLTPWLQSPHLLERSQNGLLFSCIWAFAQKGLHVSTCFWFDGFWPPLVCLADSSSRKSSFVLPGLLGVFPLCDKSPWVYVSFCTFVALKLSLGRGWVVFPAFPAFPPASAEASNSTIQRDKVMDASSFPLIPGSGWGWIQFLGSSFTRKIMYLKELFM